MSDKPATQRVTLTGMDAHQAMGTTTVPDAPPANPIPQFMIDEGIRQAQGGAHFYGKRLTDCTREELYAAVVAAWYDAKMRAQQQNGECPDCD